MYVARNNQKGDKDKLFSKRWIGWTEHNNALIKYAPTDYPSNQLGRSSLQMIVDSKSEYVLIHIDLV